MLNVLVVASGFSQASSKPVEMMREAGLSVRELDYGPGGLNQKEDEFCRIVPGMDGLIVTAIEKVTRRVFENADRLKLVAIRSSGFEGTDLKAATDHGVLVTHNPGANRQAVADMAFGLMLAVSRRMGWMDRGMRDGKYKELRVTTKEVHGKTLGIIGLGRIGKAVALRAKGFDMKVVYHDMIAYPEFAEKHDIRKIPLEQLLSESDIVTLHVPLDDSTRYMIGSRELEMMQRGTILINTARGGVVNEKAVYSALTQHHLYGYGMDVHEEEPPVFLDLLRLDSVVSTPHMAGASDQGLINMAIEAAEKVIQFLAHDTVPEDVLNREVLESPAFRRGAGRHPS
jgi:phosphoglycerate dehydrogenase-like enzyme